MISTNRGKSLNFRQYSRFHVSLLEFSFQNLVKFQRMIIILQANDMKQVLINSLEKSYSICQNHKPKAKHMSHLSLLFLRNSSSGASNQTKNKRGQNHAVPDCCAFARGCMACVIENLNNAIQWHCQGVAGYTPCTLEKRKR